jgi:D-serine deaminase-like pyridoxal phosphate-dependent protein
MEDRHFPAARLSWAYPLERPGLLLDPSRLQGNRDRMAERARAAGRPLRIHMKTIQSVELARDLGIGEGSPIAVSSLAMARLFLEQGWCDILLALPLNPAWVPELIGMNGRARVAFLLADGQVLDQLAGIPSGCDLPVWVEVDAGYGRSGIPWNNDAEMVAVCTRLRETAGLAPRGLLCHAGDSYPARGQQAVQEVADRTRMRLEHVRGCLERAGLGRWPISFGDTPCCSLASGLEAYDEWRPGNYLFHDLMQKEIGSCGEEGLALALVCPILSLRREQGRAILHGGAVHLSKEGLALSGGQVVYGQLVEAGPGGLGRLIPGAYLDRISQEHGELRAPPRVLDGLAPGQSVAVVPVHSCLCADLHREYHLPDGRTIPRSCCL